MTTEDRTVIVKESVVECRITGTCINNHPGHHTTFGGRVGRIEGDIRHILKVHPEALAHWDINKPPMCIQCGAPGMMTTRERIYTHNHYIMVCFASHKDHGATQEESARLHSAFSPDELEDFDADGVLNLVAKETIPA